MTGFGTALVVELRKARSSRVLRWTGTLLTAGVVVLSAAMVFAARAGREDVVAKLGPQAATGDWAALLSIATQVTGAASVLAFGVGLSWLIGREFADGTVQGLFALPVTRSAIALAKTAVYLLWSAVAALVLTVGVAAAGLLSGLGAPDAATIAGLGRLLVLGVLSAWVAVPAGLAAVIGRGLLPGVAVTVGVVVVAQVSVVVGAGAWMPLVAPALWAIRPSGVAGPALALVAVVPLLVVPATAWALDRIQLDR